MYLIHFYNFGNYSQHEFKDFDSAVSEARAQCFESNIIKRYNNKSLAGEIVATYSPISGLTDRRQA